MISLCKYFLILFVAFSVLACSDNGKSNTSDTSAHSSPAAITAEAKPSKIPSPKPSSASHENAESIKVAAGPIDGARAYKTCAACHLKTGDGVPGAFPPLKKQILSLSETKQGRLYLSSVLFYGVSGEIEVNDVTFRGVMPAQGGMNSAKAAAILNHVLLELNEVTQDDPRLFNASEIEQYIAETGRQSGKQVRALRANIEVD